MTTHPQLQRFSLHRLSKPVGRSEVETFAAQFGVLKVVLNLLLLLLALLLSLLLLLLLMMMMMMLMIMMIMIIPVAAAGNGLYSRYHFVILVAVAMLIWTRLQTHAN